MHLFKICTALGEKNENFNKRHTCRFVANCQWLVELSEYLLCKELFEYVILGSFSTDPFKKEFSKLRQGSGGTYFKTVQQILGKLNISKAKLPLKLNSETVNDLYQIKSGHYCDKCSFKLTEQMCDIIDYLPEMKSSIRKDSMMGLVYIAGFLISIKKKKNQ